MINDRRKPEASGLRLLFQEQWSHFLHLVDEWYQRRHDKHEEIDALSSAVEEVVSGTDARIRSVGSYKRQLRESVHTVLNYVDTLVDGLPSPVAVSKETFFSDPLVYSFFVNTEDIAQIFRNSSELQSFFADVANREVSEAYALLFVRMKEKTVLGKDLCGELLLGDVKQTTVSFSDHQIVSPCASEATARKLLKVMLFRSVVQYVRIHMIQVRHQQIQEFQQHDCLDPVHNLKNPLVYLQELTRILSTPMDLLKQHEKMLRINRMGICVADDKTDAINELHLHEITIGDQQTRIVAMVKYPRSEFLALD